MVGYPRGVSVKCVGCVRSSCTRSKKRYIPRIALKKLQFFSNGRIISFSFAPVGPEEFSKETINHKTEKRGFFEKKREQEAISVSNGGIGDSFSLKYCGQILAYIYSARI
jgi:hypothetical protein